MLVEKYLLEGQSQVEGAVKVTVDTQEEHSVFKLPLQSDHLGLQAKIME